LPPQLGLLLPVILLLDRRWLTIASAVVTTAVLVALTSMLFGWRVWAEFYQKVLPQQQWLTAVKFLMASKDTVPLEHWQGLVNQP